MTQGASMSTRRPCILVLADFIFPEYIGGSARLASELNESIYLGNGDVYCIARKPVGVYSSGLEHSRQYEVVYINELAKVVRLLFLKRWDFVVSHHFSLGILSYLVFPRQCTYYFFHGPVNLERKARGGGVLGRLYRHLLEFLVLARATKICCLSNFMRSYLPEIFKQKSAVTGPLHNMLLPATLKPKVTTGRKIKCLTVRRLTPRTGVAELAATLSLIPDAVELTVVGGGELFGLIQSMNYCNVIMQGQIDDAALAELYKTSDIVILPSLELEGFGLIIIESLLRGTPVIASNKAGGGADFLKSFSSDFVYDLNLSPIELLRKLSRAIAAYNDVDTRCRLLTAITQSSMSTFVETNFRCKVSVAAGPS